MQQRRSGLRYLLGATSAVLPLLTACGPVAGDNSAEPARLGVIEAGSICGTTDESQHVNSYDGTLGQSQAFVQRHKGAVGAMESTGTDSSSKYCSGTLIGVSLFLTAGHCVDGTTVGQFVSFNYERQAGSTTLVTQRHYRIAQVLEDDLGGLDYAIVRLAGTPGYDFGITRVRATDPAVGAGLTIIQHPGGEPKQVEVGTLTQVNGNTLRYGNIDTRGGSSGSGIIDNNGFLVGVHTNGGCTSTGGANFGTRMASIRGVSPIINELSNLPDGTVVRETGRAAIYVIQGGGRFWVPSGAKWDEWKQAMGVSDASIRTVPAGILRDVPEVPQDGTVVQELGKNAIWIFQGGGRFWAPGSNEWNAWVQATGVSAVQAVPAGSLWATIDPDDTNYRLREDLPRDGAVVREVGKNAIWVYQGGGAFWVPSGEEWGRFRTFTGSSDASIATIPLRSLSEKLVEVNGTDEWRVRNDLPRNGTVVRELNQSAIWLYQGGGKFLFPNQSEFDAWASLGVTSASVRTIPNGSLSATQVDVNGTDEWRTRNDFPREHTLLRERSYVEIYVIRGGSRFWVENEVKAQAYGYSLANTLLVPNTSLGPIPYAGPLP